jgi:hypothetical protein
VKQRREPFLLQLPCRLPHAVEPGGHARPARCPVRAALARVPLGPRPSLRRLLRRPSAFVRRLPRYYDGVRLLTPVRHRLRPSGLPDADRRRPGGRAGDLPVPAQRAYAHAGVCDHAGPGRRSHDAPLVLPSAETTASAPRRRHLSRLDTQPTRTPVNASPRASRRTTHDSGPMWFARPSSYRTFTCYSLPVSRRFCLRVSRARSDRVVIFCSFS